MFDPRMYVADPYNPWRDDVDHRWRRCEYLISHGWSPAYQRDDHVTWCAWRYRLGLSSCADQAGRQQLDRRFPAIAEAYKLFTTPTPLKRWEVEARLLAKETDTAIAAKCGFSVESVGTYSNLFYDVRPHLSAETYIYLAALKGKDPSAIAPDDFEYILKLFGYSMGGLVVDDVLDYIREPPTVPPCLNELDLLALKRLQRHLKLKVQILLLSVPAASAPPATWERLRQHYAAATCSAQGRDDNEADVLCSIKSTFDVTAALADGGQATPDTETISMPTLEPTCESEAHLPNGDVCAASETLMQAVPA